MSMRHISTQQERERKVITASKNNPTNETSSQTSGTTSTIVPHQHLSSPAVPQSPSAGSFTESGTCSSQGSKDSSSVYRVGDEMAVADPRDDEAGKSDMKHLRGGEDEDGGTDPDVDKKKIKEPSTRTADGVNDDNPSDKDTTLESGKEIRASADSGRLASRYSPATGHLATEASRSSVDEVFYLSSGEDEPFQRRLDNIKEKDNKNITSSGMDKQSKPNKLNADDESAIQRELITPPSPFGEAGGEGSEKKKLAQVHRSKETARSLEDEIKSALPATSPRNGDEKGARKNLPEEGNNHRLLSDEERREPPDGPVNEGDMFEVKSPGELSPPAATGDVAPDVTGNKSGNKKKNKNKSNKLGDVKAGRRRLLEFMLEKLDEINSPQDSGAGQNNREHQPASPTPDATVDELPTTTPRKTPVKKLKKKIVKNLSPKSTKARRVSFGSSDVMEPRDEDSLTRGSSNNNKAADDAASINSAENIDKRQMPVVTTEPKEFVLTTAAEEDDDDRNVTAGRQTNFVLDEGAENKAEADDVTGEGCLLPDGGVGKSARKVDVNDSKPDLVDPEVENTSSAAPTSTFARRDDTSVPSRKKPNKPKPKNARARANVEWSTSPSPSSQSGEGSSPPSNAGPMEGRRADGEGGRGGLKSSEDPGGGRADVDEQTSVSPAAGAEQEMILAFVQREIGRCYYSHAVKRACAEQALLAVFFFAFAVLSNSSRIFPIVLARPEDLGSLPADNMSPSAQVGLDHSPVLKISILLATLLSPFVLLGKLGLRFVDHVHELQADLFAAWSGHGKGLLRGLDLLRARPADTLSSSQHHSTSPTTNAVDDVDQHHDMANDVAQRDPDEDVQGSSSHLFSTTDDFPPRDWACSVLMYDAPPLIVRRGVSRSYVEQLSTE